MTTRWLTMADAATYIAAKDHRLIRDAIRAGELRAYRYGTNDIRITADDVDEWMKSKEIGAQ